MQARPRRGPQAAGDAVVVAGIGIPFAPATADLGRFVEQVAPSALDKQIAAGWRLDQLDADALTVDAIRRAQAGRHPRRVRAGETIAYVGDTGNAGAGNYHLHFAVARMGPGERWWQGTPVDPYPLLAGARRGG